MRSLLVLLLLARAFGSSVIEHAHKSSVEIAQSSVLSDSRCTATAIGPHALLTASHCEQPTDEITVDGFDGKAKIVHIVRDGNDHSIYLLSGVTFKYFSKVDLLDPAEQGEQVFFFGNPGELSDIYRRGYIAGKREASESLFGGDTPAVIFFDVQDFHGDSGSGIFNVNGDVICVVSSHVTMGTETDTIRFTAGLPITFKQDQLDQAATFAPLSK